MKERSFKNQKMIWRLDPPISFCAPVAINFEDDNEIIIDKNEISIRFIQPLVDPIQLEFHSENGFTKQLLAEIIYNQYVKIYKEDEDHLICVNGKQTYKEGFKSNIRYWALENLYLEDIVYRDDSYYVPVMGM